MAFGYPNDQGNPLAAIPVWIAGTNTYNNQATNARTQVKSSPGSLQSLSVNTLGTTSSVKFYDGLSKTITVNVSTPSAATINWAAHGLSAGDAVQFTTTGALPTGITAGTTYYVSINNLTADVINIADTQAHALAGTNSVVTTGTQSGVHTGWDVTRPIGTFATTTQGLQWIGASFTKGLWDITAGGAAADITVLYK
jgi:hypothetical protein